MILVLEHDAVLRIQYFDIFEQLAEDFMVVMSLADLEVWLMDPSQRIDLVIGELAIENDVKKLRPEAAFLPITHEAHQPGDPATDLVSTAAKDFPLQLKRAVKKALQSRMLSAVMARVCHEVNNPASVILGNAELILVQDSELGLLPKEVKDMLSSISHQSVRIGEATARLARLVSNGVDLEIQSMSGLPIIAFPESEFQV